MAKKIESPFPKFQPPMLATLADAPFSRERWFFEPKLDGIRCLAYIKKGQVNLYSRRGLSLGVRYPGLVKELSAYKQNLIIDGEIVAFDSKGRPSFEELQQRSGLNEEQAIGLAESKTPIQYYVFDILYCDGLDLRELPLTERKKLLKKNIKRSKRIKLVENLGEDGETAFQACLENGLEGIMGKKADSPYYSGYRTRNWLKVKSTLSDEFLVCGYTQGTGTRQKTFGALILGRYNQDQELVYVSNVGTGFDDKRLYELMKLMKPLITKQSPFKKVPKGQSHPVWLKPKLVAEIKFAEKTKEGSLRVPVFMHLRQDVKPTQVEPKPVVHISKKRS